MRTWTRLSTILATAGATLLATACGGGSSNPDSRVTDTNMNPDAGTPDGSPDAAVANRSLTVSIADVTVTTPGATGIGLKGEGILLESADISQGGGELVYGTSPVNGCVVYRYSKTDGKLPNPGVDDGTFTLSGPGFKKPVGMCSFVTGVGYLCVPNAGTATTTVTSVGGGVFTVKFAGKDLSATNLVASYLSLSGVTGWTSPVPVLAQPGADTVTVLNPAGVAATDVAGAGYTFIAGAGPIPSAILGSDASFLQTTDGTNPTKIRIDKTAGANWGAITDLEIQPSGQGFKLDPTKGQAHGFPQTAQDFTLACDPANCGTASGEALRGILITGRTTDAVIPGTAKPWEMGPPGVPEATVWHTFTCGFLQFSAADETKDVTIPMAAITEILKDSPTRVEMRVVKASLTQPMDPVGFLNGSNMVVGFGVVGHTTINPAAK